MRRIMLLLAVLLVPATAMAQCYYEAPATQCYQVPSYPSTWQAPATVLPGPAPEPPRPQIPRATCMQSDYQASWPVVQVASARAGRTVMSTGLPVGEVNGERLVLTTAHSVEEGTPTELLARDLRVSARVVATDNRHDVALLRAQVPSDHPLRNWQLHLTSNELPTPQLPQPQAEQDPAWGGFAPGEYQYRQMAAPAMNLTSGRFWTKGHIQEGMSGGPVYDANSRLLGMIVAEGREDPWVMAVNSTWLRAFVARNVSEDERIALRLQLPRDWEHLNAIAHVGHPDWRPVSWSSANRSIFGRPSWLD